MSQEIQSPSAKVVLHAPTPSGLERARNNFMNIKKVAPDTDVRIIANAQAVATALDQEHAECDGKTWICPNTLANMGREARAPLQVIAGPAVMELVRLQQEGWIYIRS
jgi:intracellular sulfur oxidation DsrE/DsrF family protein